MGVGECFSPGLSGHLIKNGDQADFIASLDKLIRAPAQRKTFSEAARRHARENFTAERQIQAHLSLFTQIAGR